MMGSGHRGHFNPETGMMRVQCDDRVAWGDHGGFEEKFISRFKGEIGQRYTVECPPGCGLTQPFLAPIWGCNPFLDESSICKAAVGMGKIQAREGGAVSFQLVKPEKEYKSCDLQHGIDSDLSLIHI